MEWERLFRVGLLGNANLEEYAILLVRVALGLFFAVSGGTSCLSPAGRNPCKKPWSRPRVPLPRLMTYLVSAVELVGGCLLILGLLSSFVSLALLVDMLVAILTTSLAAHAERAFTFQLAGRFPLSSGSALRTVLRLADLFRPRKIQR